MQTCVEWGTPRLSGCFSAPANPGIFTRMLAYKGVAPGTYYTSVDPRAVGFNGELSRPTSFDHIITHITAHSWPSAWISVSLSFAVAAEYATSGGSVYEIELDRVGHGDITDPLRSLIQLADSTLRFLHQHDGHQDLIPGVCDPLRQSVLTSFPLRPGQPPSRKMPAPNISRHLNALVFATRDSELLVSSIPPRAVGNVYAIL